MAQSIPPFPNPKENLVVVRAGSKSLHANWLALPHEDRNWDLIVSYFDEAAFNAHPPQTGVQKVLLRGGKWDGLFKTFSQCESHTQYAHIWLPDDDIATDGAAINMMFDQAKRYDLAVCQPALTHDSYYSHFLFMKCPEFSIRYTNYIEIMIPCLEASLFAQALPLFEDTMSGFGLDYIWCRLPGAGPHKAAILDEVTMHHTRPIGSQLKSNIVDQKGKTAKEEGAKLRAQMGGLKKAVPLAYAGITKEGVKIEGRLKMALRMRQSYAGAMDQFADQDLAKVKNRQLFKRQLIIWSWRLMTHMAPMRVSRSRLLWTTPKTQPTYMCIFWKMGP